MKQKNIPLSLACSYPQIQSVHAAGLIRIPVQITAKHISFQLRLKGELTLRSVDSDKKYCFEKFFHDRGTICKKYFEHTSSAWLIFTGCDKD